MSQRHGAQSAYSFHLQTKVELKSVLTTHGYSLIELLLGLGMGSFVAVAALIAYQTSRLSWQSIRNTESVFQNAQIALRHIRTQVELDGVAYLINTAANRVALSPDYPISYNPSDGLVVSHWHGADAWDCQGNSASNPDALISNSFKRNSNQELACKDLNAKGSSYQALAEGVEDFQTRFAQYNPTLRTVQWVNASQLFGSGQIVAIEVCVRLASISRQSNLFQTMRAQPTTGCTNETIAADGKYRRVFRRVIALRNRFLSD